ncbi:hypothetical protein Syun_012567 [Stephania yunnanensis]|uniref:Uncharacterized protein n=1 Tax=Stephania yunnanensis TaxID=152371 RepID=A0AAP0PGI0_9MAGN
MLVNVSCGNCLTYLPLRSSLPSIFREKFTIGVTNVNNIHWVRIKFKDDAPLLPIFPLWNTFVESDAKEWGTRFRVQERTPVMHSQQGTSDVIDLSEPKSFKQLQYQIF